MDDKEVQKTTENSLLEELVNNSQKQLFYERVRTVAALVIAVSIVMGIVLVVPKALVTVQKANDIMEQASETIILANSSIESVTSMS